MCKRSLLMLLASVAVILPLGADDSPQETNKALVRRFFDEVWNKGNVDVAEEVFADDYVRHDPRGGKPPAGGRGQKLIARAFRKDCPECVLTIDRLLADGDFVVAQWTIRGTHAPSGKPIDFVGVNIMRIANGKVVEIWNHRDDLGFSQQIGRVTMNPPAGQPRPDSP